MKMGDEKTLFQKVGAISTSALVLCGVIAAAAAVKTQEGAVPVDILPTNALIVELPETEEKITIAPAGAVVRSLEEESTTSTTTTQKTAATVSVDFSKIRAYNQDVKAQIYLPGTKLNYWVAQGTDNSFYLNHNAYKQSFAWGTPMIDYRTTLTKDARSTNVVIYGHSNDKTGEHFSAIKNYNEIGRAHV